VHGHSFGSYGRSHEAERDDAGNERSECTTHLDMEASKYPRSRTSKRCDRADRGHALNGFARVSEGLRIRSAVHVVAAVACSPAAPARALKTPRGRSRVDAEHTQAQSAWARSRVIQQAVVASRVQWLADVLGTKATGLRSAPGRQSEAPRGSRR
jgi:hypothetical protein